MTRWEIATESQHRRMRWAFAIGVALGLATAPSVSTASTAEERAMADALFREAKVLMHRENYQEACSKLQESQRLDPRDGTLLNLAVCHEKEGKIATAWVEFQEALAAAKAAKRWDRIQLAKRRLKALEGKIPNLTIEVAPGAAVDGFELMRNGVPIAQPVWGTPIPVDPGEQALEAKAPGMMPWSNTFVLEVGEDKTVVVPVLEAEPLPPPPPPEPKPTPKPKPPEGPSSRQMTAYVVGGVGVVAMGVGTFFGLRAISKSNESDDHCRGTLCDQSGLDLNDDARSAAKVSNIAIGLGLVGVGVGTYLLLTEPDNAPERGAEKPAKGRSSADSAARIQLVPVAGREQAAIVVRGAW